MRYLGGKHHLGKKIAVFLKSLRDNPLQTYLEPFVGACGVFRHMKNPRVGADLHPFLIALLKAAQLGWLPPSRIDEAFWRRLKNGDGSDELRGFAGFCCSFAGKWFAGFCRRSRYDYPARSGRHSLVKLRQQIKSVEFFCLDYKEWDPVGCLIYCDPPYQNLTHYDKQEPFCTQTFWDTVREWSVLNIVVVSEFKAPNDFVCVKSFDIKTRLRSKPGNRKGIKKTECLFMHERQATLSGLRNVLRLRTPSLLDFLKAE